MDAMITAGNSDPLRLVMDQRLPIRMSKGVHIFERCL